MVGSYGSVWTREEECKVEEGGKESGRANKKNSDINRIPPNMWESRDEGPASREGPTEGTRILQPSSKKKKNTEIESEDSTHVGSQMLTIKPSLLAHALPEMWEEEKVPRHAGGLAAEQKRSS